MTVDPSIGVDQRVALKISAKRLTAEFSTIFNAATTERFLRSSYDEIAQTTTTSQYLPQLAERFARQRLQALARIEGHVRDGKPVVLFLCVHNADRSQIALGFFTRYAADNAIAWSGGSEPSAAISQVTVAAMAERSIDISGEFPKPWTNEVIQAADVVITLSSGDACPIFLGKWNQEWRLDDPTEQNIETVRSIRDDIEQRVLALLKEIGVTAPGQC